MRLEKGELAPLLVFCSSNCVQLLLFVWVSVRPIWSYWNQKLFQFKLQKSNKTAHTQLFHALISLFGIECAFAFCEYLGVSVGVILVGFFSSSFIYLPTATADAWQRTPQSRLLSKKKMKKKNSPRTDEARVGRERDQVEHKAIATNARDELQIYVKHTHNPTPKLISPYPICDVREEWTKQKMNHFFWCGGPPIGEKSRIDNNNKN